MTFPRLILGSIVGLAAASGAFEPIVGIGSGGRGMVSVAFATDNDGGKAEFLFNPPPGYNPPPGQPTPQPSAQPAVQPASQPSAQPAAQPASVKTPPERLQEINAEIATVEGALVEKNGEIQNLQTKITNLGQLGARNLKWESQLDKKQKQRTELGNRLNSLYNQRTVLIAVILRVVAAPPP